MPRIMRILLATAFPFISFILFVFSASVLPWAMGGPTMWWIVALVTAGPLAMNVWAVFLTMRQPVRIRLDSDAMVWETGFKKVKRIPKERVLRLEPLQDRKYGLAMCFYLDENGREKWTGVTVEIERAIRAWMAQSERGPEALPGPH